MRLQIRELRKKRGWTIEQLGQMLGLSKGFLSEVETGKKFMSAATMEAAAAVFGVSVIELYDAGDLTPELNAIADHLRQMSPAQRQTAVRLVSSLVDPKPTE